MTEFKWVVYGLITLIVALGFSSLYQAVRMWREPMEYNFGYDINDGY